MQYALFADPAVMIKIIFAVLVGVYWLISWVGKAFAQQQQQQAEAARRAAARPQMPGKKPDAAAELEQFLNELGFKRPQSENSPRPMAPAVAEKKPSQPRPRPNKRIEPPALKNAKAMAPSAPASASVEKRHLKSNLETRHQQSMHSQLESKHLQSQVTQRHLTSDIVVAQSSHSTAPAVGRVSMSDTIRNGPLLINAFVLGEVLGTPLAMRE